MEQFVIVFIFFIIALLGMWGALKFSKFEGEGDEECDNPEQCILRKIGLSKLHCDN